ncbi:Cytochrome P450 [Corchorus olitorius]|uniref:Cytochrome P450 n=1 Tax=Corchorus olitorius TaxID=93759 RepID=A0A1R3GUF3_9ROSI|nr:Cytochrome P450 [Corchorus olitorius]
MKSPIPNLKATNPYVPRIQGKKGSPGGNPQGNGALGKELRGSMRGNFAECVEREKMSPRENLGEPGESSIFKLSKWVGNVSVLQIARDEIDSIVGTSRLVEETDIPKLNNVQAIVKEALRLHPTTFIREEIQHYGKTQMSIAPEKFLVPSKTETSKKQDFDFIPFGGGRRACPSKNLAYATMNITIAYIIQCIDLEVIASRHLLAETSLRIHKVIEGKKQSAEKRGHKTLV